MQFFFHPSRASRERCGERRNYSLEFLECDVLLFVLSLLLLLVIVVACFRRRWF
jgi:hypothetical protein